MSFLNKSAAVYVNSVPAGILSKNEGDYQFSYLPEYLADVSMPALSFCFPKQVTPFTSRYLFPFFFGLLSEGENKHIICRQLKIDENDYFTLLLKTAMEDTTGAVTVKEIENE